MDLLIINYLTFIQLYSLTLLGSCAQAPLIYLTHVCYRLSVYPSDFFISDQFKILADDQLYYKSCRIRKKVGGNHYNIPHYPPSYTHHIAIFAVFDCFWLVWRPVAPPNELLCIFWFYQSKGKVHAVILHTLPICLFVYFRSYAKKLSFQRHHFCRRYVFEHILIRLLNIWNWNLKVHSYFETMAISNRLRCLWHPNKWGFVLQ